MDRYMMVIIFNSCFFLRSGYLKVSSRFLEKTYIFDPRRLVAAETDRSCAADPRRRTDYLSKISLVGLFLPVDLDTYFQFSHVIL